VSNHPSANRTGVNCDGGDAGVPAIKHLFTAIRVHALWIYMGLGQDI